MPRLRVFVPVAVVMCLVAGFLVAVVLNSALAIRFEDKNLGPEPATTVQPAAPVEPIASLADIVLPVGHDDDPLLTLAAEQVTAAAGSRTHTGSAVTVEVDLSGPEESESYAVRRSGATLTVSGGRRGVGYGLFRLADAIASGADWGSVADGVLREPDLPHRFVDTGAVGVVPDEAAYRAQDDYQHTSGALADVVLAEAPWLDPAGLARTEADWKEFIDHVVAYGYNGVFVPGFLEYVSFDTVGTGTQVYAADSPERARQEAMREQVGALWKYAADLGVDVVFKTDMLALSGPLESYLQRELGGIDPTDPRLWEVYRAGMDEFFTTFPWAKGLMIRIGEAGTIYNVAGWDYYSALEVRDAAAVQTMLRTASEVAAEHDATIYFRTWSVGVGDVGDMHTNPQTYERVLGDLDLPNLVVSTKFTMGDFDSFLPLNPTLTGGDQQRVVELQGRREFEAFSSIPNDVGRTHQEALREFRAANPNIAGLWLWTQDGGPWRAGPFSLYLKEGFWQLYDLNVYAAGRLGWDLDADIGEVNRAWITRMLTADPAAATAVADVLAMSRSAILDGFYIGPYAEQAVFALGLEPPPMMWIFKWDIVSGDVAGLSAVYLATAGRVDEAIAEGERAVATARAMRDRLADVDRSTFHDPDLYDRLAASIDYEIDLFATLQTYRSAFLRYYEWVDTGSVEAQEAWLDERSAYREASAAHTERWTGDLAHPPYEFFAADAGLVHAERAPYTQIVAWVVIALGGLGLLLIRDLRRGAFTPWRLGTTDTAPSRTRRILVVAVPLAAVLASRLAFSSAASTAYLLVTLGSLALLALTARVVLWAVRPGADPHWLWAGLGGMLLLRTVILGAGMAGAGPSGYWFRIWTDESGRTVYVTLAAGAFLWGLVVLALVLRSAYRVSWPGAIGAVLLGVGVPLLALGLLLSGVGLERSLTTINDQLAILPLGLSRILGLVTHLGIPTALPQWLLTAGATLGGVGALGTLGAAVRGRKDPRVGT